MADRTVLRHQRVLLCRRHRCPDRRICGSERNRHPNAHEVSLWVRNPAFLSLSLVYFGALRILGKGGKAIEDPSWRSVYQRVGRDDALAGSRHSFEAGGETTDITPSTSRDPV